METIHILAGVLGIVLFVGMSTTTSTMVTRPAFLVDWGSAIRTHGRQFNFAQVAIGRVVVLANSAKIVTAGTVVGEMAGLIVPVADYTGDPTAITNTTVTAKVAKVAHGLAVGDLITVSGAAETEYNGTFPVSAVTDVDNYEYIMPADPGGSATGTLVIRLQAKLITEEVGNEKSELGAAKAISCLQGASLFENMLPEATGTPPVIPAAWKAELITNGYAYVFSQYVDTRLT